MSKKHTPPLERANQTPSIPTHAEDAQTTSQPPIAAGAIPLAVLRSSDLPAFQQTMGNQATQRLLTAQPRAQQVTARLAGAGCPTPIIQRIGGAVHIDLDSDL